MSHALSFYITICRLDVQDAVGIIAMRCGRAAPSLACARIANIPCIASDGALWMDTISSSSSSSSTNADSSGSKHDAMVVLKMRTKGLDSVSSLARSNTDMTNNEESAVTANATAAAIGSTNTHPRSCPFYTTATSMDVVTIDGITGQIFLGAKDLVRKGIDADTEELLGWARGLKTVQLGWLVVAPSPLALSPISHEVRESGRGGNGTNILAPTPAAVLLPLAMRSPQLQQQPQQSTEAIRYRGPIEAQRALTAAYRNSRRTWYREGTQTPLEQEQLSSAYLRLEAAYSAMLQEAKASRVIIVELLDATEFRITQSASTREKQFLNSKGLVVLTDDESDNVQITEVEFEDMLHLQVKAIVNGAMQAANGKLHSFQLYLALPLIRCSARCFTSRIAAIRKALLESSVVTQSAISLAAAVPSPITFVVGCTITTPWACVAGPSLIASRAADVEFVDFDIDKLNERFFGERRSTATTAPAAAMGTQPPPQYYTNHWQQHDTSRLDMDTMGSTIKAAAESFRINSRAGLLQV
jgi:hypothetical protein